MDIFHICDVGLRWVALRFQIEVVFVHGLEKVLSVFKLDNGRILVAEILDFFLL